MLGERADQLQLRLEGADDALGRLALMGHVLVEGGFDLRNYMRKKLFTSAMNRFYPSRLHIPCPSSPGTSSAWGLGAAAYSPTGDTDQRCLMSPVILVLPA